MTYRLAIFVSVSGDRDNCTHLVREAAKTLLNSSEAGVTIHKVEMCADPVILTVAEKKNNLHDIVLHYRTNMNRIAITYPPEYDGELHIAWELTSTKYMTTYTFGFQAIKKEGEDAWETLVRCARDIIAEEERIKMRKRAALIVR